MAIILVMATVQSMVMVTNLAKGVMGMIWVSVTCLIIVIIIIIIEIWEIVITSLIVVTRSQSHLANSKSAC